jgi:hypothetical protein
MNNQMNIEDIQQKFQDVFIPYYMRLVEQQPNAESWQLGLKIAQEAGAALANLDKIQLEMLLDTLRSYDHGTAWNEMCWYLETLYRA